MRLVPLLLVALLVAGCSLTPVRAWPPATPPADDAVVFAPVALGPLAPIYPEARTVWAEDLAGRLWVSTRSAVGYAATAWPGSEDPAWQRGLPPEPGPVRYAVLTRIIAVEDVSSVHTGRRWLACVAMRVLDAQGREVWSRTSRLECPVEDLGKLPGPQARPESRAAWMACTNAVGAFGDWLAAQGGRPAGPPAPALAAGEVAIELGSQPDHADVLVDGVLRGTTPCILALPAGKPVRLRLERTGCQPWEREVVPQAALRLAPALAPAP